MIRLNAQGLHKAFVNRQVTSDCYETRFVYGPDSCASILSILFLRYTDWLEDLVVALWNMKLVTPLDM